MIRADLSGKKALVTGGAAGIGSSTASLFARMGATVAINDLPGNPQLAETVAGLESEGLEVLVIASAELEETWNGPYLKRSMLLDPWKNPYEYRADGEINPGSFDLISYGADGQDGGEGDNEDIYNE